MAYDDGLRFLREARRERAESSLALAVRLDPSLAAAWLARAMATPDPERRQRYYRLAFQLDPFIDLSVLESGLQTAQLGDAWRDLEQRLRLASSGGISTVDPQLLWVHLLVAARTGHLVEAMADAGELLRRTELPLLTRNDVRLMLAALQERAGLLDQSVMLYQEVINEDLSNFAAHARLADIHERRGDLAAALAERRRALDANPADFTLRLALAATLARAGRLRDADAELSEVIRIAPWDRRAHDWQRQVRAQLR